MMSEQDERMLPARPSAEQVGRMEDAVMDRIRVDDAQRRTRRHRVWGGAAAAVAVVALAAFISPAVTSGISGAGGGASTAEDSAALPADGPVSIDGSDVQLPDPGTVDGSGGIVEGSAPEVAGGDASSGIARDDATAGRDVVATGWVQLTVTDVSAAIAQVTELATTEGGYVESASVGTTDVRPLEGTDSMPVTGSQITVRVPADRLDAVIAEVGGYGEVTSSTIDRTDVTDQAVDLRARIAAQEASVARLTELMSQAGSVGDLIAAETALSERQAALDADRQQLASLEDRVSLSGLTVSLTPQIEVTRADPAGFGDGLAAGWNGLVATLNGTVVALGFLLPWLAVAAVALGIVWGVRRLVVRSRQRRSPAASED
ncbi:MAG: hypothetical protein K0Q58_273 [Microbacterium sp.]|jgi:hypothetical protein|nr:hypothetical protein [Microbacterium sp.]